MVAANRIRQSVFLSTLVWAWAIHHMPMFDGGIQISLSVSTLSYPVAVLAAYLAVYKRQVIVTVLLLLVTVVATELYYDYTLSRVAESLLVLGGTGLLYAFGLRLMVRRMKQHLQQEELVA